MPRALLAILKACWALLAWVLFLSGVIGCDPGSRALAGGSPEATYPYPP
jgi:hypothetical protein